MTRFVLRICLIALAVICALYAVDWIVWQIRSARGNGSDEVTVNQVSAAELKRNREEYYFEGQITITCARSLFPPLTAQGWLPTCWYMQHHRVVVTHI